VANKESNTNPENEAKYKPGKQRDKEAKTPLIFGALCLVSEQGLCKQKEEIQKV